LGTLREHDARDDEDDQDPGRRGAEPPGTEAAAALDEPQARLADELVTRARQTSATVTFIEDGRLLAEVGGMGAFLRYRV
jgi:peptide subunit release factor 1 (eRF1)